MKIAANQKKAAEQQEIQVRKKTTQSEPAPAQDYDAVRREAAAKHEEAKLAFQAAKADVEKNALAQEARTYLQLKDGCQIQMRTLSVYPTQAVVLYSHLIHAGGALEACLPHHQNLRTFAYVLRKDETIPRDETIQPEDWMVSLTQDGLNESIRLLAHEQKLGD